MIEIAPVEVTMHIAAPPQDVFPYFTDPARYVYWMGSEAKLEPEPGGIYRVHMSDGSSLACRSALAKDMSLRTAMASLLFASGEGALTAARARPGPRRTSLAR
jgi:hypothetical protein